MTNENIKEEVLINNISPSDVHSTLSKNMLTDGFKIVLDLNKSQGSTLVDEKTGETYLDFFTFFASSPFGMNHPKLLTKEVKEELLTAAINKPSNSDIYTTMMASFVDTFSKLAKPDYMKYLFFIAGGALAVENALKTAFDWKVRKNFAKGYQEEKGQKVIHFKQAFHGRSGYTLSLTNTEPNKVNYFPKFNWPRIINPKITFPLDDNLENIIKLEEQAVNEIQNAIKENRDDIAALIIEPIQGEGGDIQFRKEFFVKLREIADENELLLIFDEVQTGFGLTGKFWAHEYYVKPDILVFGKKAQVCGIASNERVDEVEENVFHKSSRINSTWGANLVDMVRSKHILRIINEDNLLENSTTMGKYLLESIRELQDEFPELVSNSRGLGLMCAFDLSSREIRDKFQAQCYNEKLLILGCGEKSIRFRPRLDITKDDLDKGLNIIEKVLNYLSSK